MAPFNNIFQAIKTKYYDERNNTYYSFHDPEQRLIVVFSSDKKWISGYRITDKYCHFRPFLIRKDGMVVLADFTINCNMEIEMMKSTGSAHTGLFSFKWYEINLGNSELPSKVINNSIPEMEYIKSWIGETKYIRPLRGNDILKENLDFYDRLLLITGANNHWCEPYYAIYPSISVTIIDGCMKYYISRVTGHYRGRRYEIIIDNSQLNVIKGEIELLETILKSMKDDYCYQSLLLKYEPIYPSRFFGVINEWVRSGCVSDGTVITGAWFNNCRGEFRISELQTGNLVIIFNGINYEETEITRKSDSLEDVKQIIENIRDSMKANSTNQKYC